jgi:hypothetical protein
MPATSEGRFAPAESDGRGRLSWTADSSLHAQVHGPAEGNDEARRHLWDVFPGPAIEV